MPDPSRNLELKFRCDDLDLARAGAIRVGARPTAVLEQEDTYFHCARGRLKLRELATVEAAGTRRASAELIAYDRADGTSVRQSEYRLVPAPDPPALKAALAATLGVRCIVRKRRELLLYDNVRIHLDTVESLGTFVEFEAVLAPPVATVADPSDPDELASAARIATLCAAMSLAASAAVAGSYADLASD